MAEKDPRKSGNAENQTNSQSDRDGLFVDPIKTMPELRQIIQPGKEDKDGRCVARGIAFCLDRKASLDHWSDALQTVASVSARRGNGVRTLLVYYGRYDLQYGFDFTSVEAVEESTIERLGHAGLSEGELDPNDVVPAVATLTLKSAIATARFSEWTQEEMEEHVDQVLRRYHPEYF